MKLKNFTQNLIKTEQVVQFFYICDIIIIGDYMKFYEPGLNEIRFELEEYREYFDNMFKNIDPNINLDEQQRTAVLLDAENLLVVAGAGSGKTTTMVAKVKFLIDHCGYKQSEIAVLSFTKKVEEELKRIIHDGFGYKSVNISTFHSLGLKIIRESGENYYDIVDDGGQYKIFSNYIKKVLFLDKEKFKQFISAFGKMLFFDDKWSGYANFEEYHTQLYLDQMKRLNFSIEEYNRHQIDKRKTYRKTIMGEYVKSKEEVEIANFLYVNGIEYKYEMKFDKSSTNNKWYHPDFYINQLEKESYIEHFGIDEDGHNDMYTKDQLKTYLNNMNIKQSFHNQQDNVGLFIVTYSRYNNGGTYLKKLKEQLTEKGYCLKSRSQEEIYDMLKNTGQDSYIAVFIDKLLIPFVSLFKQQTYKYEDFDKFISENDGDLREQLIVMKDFFKYYQDELDKKRLIDFEDMIYKAYIVMPKMKEKNLGVDFKYLIIDEYQDISSQRLNLVKRMSELFDAKVMAVGDDWQTIFGYSGSRVDLFKNFEQELKNAKSIPIEHTYRNSQELIDIAGKFVLKNDEQIVKNLTSNKHLINPVELLIFDDVNRKEMNENRSIVVDKIINHIYNLNPSNNVLLLGRYKNDVYKIECGKMFTIFKDHIVSRMHPDMKIDFMTIHKAKGLGYDYCILIDLNDGTYGFPSKIEDKPIMRLIKPKISETIDYPEERRLFYVALTRTKNKIYLLVPKTHVSEFAQEIRDYINVKIINITHQK